jgi:pilus assembly protein FimV
MSLNPGVSFDLDQAGDASPGAAAAATKLELAKAYIEIGDAEGAKEILQEVSREGSAAQRDEAKKILAGI